MNAMNAKKCDRCKSLYEERCTPDLQLIRYRHPYGDERIDLCPECLSELEKWLVEQEVI